MRTFIALDIPVLPSLKLLYTDLTANLTGLNIKYAEIQTLHLTMAFLGDTSEEQVKAIIGHLNHLKTEYTPFTIELSSLGQFGKSTSPQIIWVGIKPNDMLTHLWNQVNSCIKLEHFEPDPRGFAPHLTIGRVKFSKPNNNIDLFLNKYKNYDFGSVKIDKFVYYQSILKPEGPVYDPLSTIIFD